MVYTYVRGAYALRLGGSSPPLRTEEDFVNVLNIQTAVCLRTFRLALP